MEFNSTYQDLNGIEPLVTDNSHIYISDYQNEEEQPSFLEAKTVYILMPKNVPISRTSRLQWLLDHLNTTITLKIPQSIDYLSNDLEVISAVPRETSLSRCNRFLITCRSEVVFLAHTYRFVFCLDMSPSHATVDIEKDEILFDEVLNCFKAFLEGLLKQFMIPGSDCVFQPCIYITVMVNTPFYISPAQQVLVKGIQISLCNVQEVIRFIHNQFYLIEGKISDVAATAHDQIELQKEQSEALVGRLFDLPDKEQINAKMTMVSPDVNFVNMLRYSMLAISLLPENSLSHILVITDGVVAMPDSNIMESLLFQLHYDSISVSFLKVGSTFNPHTSAGYVSYSDLLYFVAQSTRGSCLENFHLNVKQESSAEFNIYHELFLLWSFHGSSNRQKDLISNFTEYKILPLLTKRQTEENVNASILLLLARRLREGFTVDNITYFNGILDIKLCLQWKPYIYIHYKVSAQRPSIKNNAHYEVYISAPYEFLHDITCLLKKDQKSLFRHAVIERFWSRLSHLSTAESVLLQQLSSFPNHAWYNLPESVRSRIPVFDLHTTSNVDSMKLAVSSIEPSLQKFGNVWQPICQMETHNWRKWFHTHKISIVLKHDQQLPKYLHSTNSSHRYQVVQCRQAATILHEMLANWCSSVLIDNHTYLKFLHKEQDKPPNWFCLIRITSKLPCAVLNLGFLTATPGIVRYEVCEELRRKLASLTFKLGPMETKENFCCLLLQKPLEKILIRYERMPTDFNTVVFPDGTQPPNTSSALPAPVTGTLFTTLSRYLFHKRWIWSAMLPSNPRLTDTAVSRILSTLTRMRLKEEFNFVHSSSGIITMALELWMDTNASCVVQYVLFPPHRAWWSDEFSCSEEDFDTDNDYEAELQMVTEVWIEPQCGRVVSNNPRTGYMDKKLYYEIADVISKVDSKCINSLLTMEHLSLMCQEKMYIESHQFSRLNSINSGIGTNNKTCTETINQSNDPGSPWYPMSTQRIEHIPFIFDPIGVLPLCHLTEQLFSMFLEYPANSTKENIEKPNMLLLDNIQEHLSYLHDQELELSREASDQFTQHILIRHKNKHPNYCPIVTPPTNKIRDADGRSGEISQWRCFLRAISVTHIILTFIPSSLQDLKHLVDVENTTSTTDQVDTDVRLSSRESACSDVPIHSSKSLVLPLYIFDCPLAMLVNAYINNTEENRNYQHDVYENHLFKYSDFIHEECLRLKSVDLSRKHLEMQSEETETTDLQNTSKNHCKALVLTHSKCFTVSMFLALHLGLYMHASDVQSAMDQCEEEIVEVDVTNYIKTVCGHLKNHHVETIEIQHLHQATPCSELKYLHMLIKEKFFKIVTTAFSPISTNTEFYFYRGESYEDDKEKFNDSDDDNSNTQSEVTSTRVEKDPVIFSEHPHLLNRMSSRVSDTAVRDLNPLFLHFVCTVKYNNVEYLNTSIRVIPTCLGELIQEIDSATKCIDKLKLQATLDIFCLTLPKNVQDVITNYSSQSLRTTSFCSDGFQPSISSTISQNSFSSEHDTELHHLEPHSNFPKSQKRAVVNLENEIKWLLQDEMATALLDIYPVSMDSLNFVTRHVAESENRSSCILDVIELNFVYGSESSIEKFVQEFSKIHIPGYDMRQQGGIYYLVKDVMADKVLENKLALESPHSAIDMECSLERQCSVSKNGSINSDCEPVLVGECFNLQGNAESVSQQSDISSGSVSATDIGYDEDISDNYDEFEWLLHMGHKRQYLPNFWLIMKLEEEAVTIYFHCRFLELPTSQVAVYLETQRVVGDAIRDICKRVNQSLLLQSMYETRLCDQLLEPEDVLKDWSCDMFSNLSNSVSYSKLSCMDETLEDNEVVTVATSLSNVSLTSKPGDFSCPVVWETHFILHPRLKTGPGKPGISRGILALKNVLDKFSVSNRNNMFVYQDRNSNVFYLRLHENVHNSTLMKASSMRSNEFESVLVSRSPSVASLPLGHTRSSTQSEQSIAFTSSSDIRPRVRSFGEKESKEDLPEDTLILKVHGITEAGTDIQHDLTQVLQNRLDDAVLEFLSVMLARNSMCPLTPEDVHFIQKPFRSPEVILKLSLHECAVLEIDSLIHYLRQNLLQFLNIPKYTDSRPHYHFQDYSETDQVGTRTLSEENIFIYNQSQIPSSGSRGIACICFTLITPKEKETYSSVNLEEIFKNAFNAKTFETLVETRVIGNDDEVPDVYLEFCLWNQGRVNIDTLTNKLKSAVRQATWDIFMEYYLLEKGLCEPFERERSFKISPIRISEMKIEASEDIEFECLLQNNKAHIRPTVTCDDGRKVDAFLLPRKKNLKVIPPNARTTRSITFDDFEKEKEANGKLQQNPKSLFKFDPYESGTDGILCDIYAKFLPEWLEFGASLSVPSVKKHQINLNTCHSPTVIIKEMMNLVQDFPRAFRSIPLNSLKCSSEEIFAAFTTPYYIQRCIIISRNLEHWKATTTSTGAEDVPDILNRQSLKHIQKFTPIIQNNSLIPRQKIVWILIESDCIVMYAYNWTKDHVEKLISNCTNLGLWLNVRSYYLNSVIDQKLGLFHNQPITRKSFVSSNNPYASYIGNLEYMSEFPRDISRRSTIMPGPNILSTVEAFRDAFHHSKYFSADPVVVFTVEMREIRAIEKKLRDEMKKLHSLYQSRTSSTTMPNIQLLLQHSRIVHFCHTPLLFLPRWRLKSAATRDHSLFPTIMMNGNEKIVVDEKEAWHTDLCYSFFTDYRCFLQTLGFMSLQIDCQHRKPGLWTKDLSSYNSIFYIQKTILGGLLLFTMEFVEPFFTTKLYAIECSRLQVINSKASINRFTLGFLDECDRIKISMHLHSFTYDYHLRAVYNYISENTANKLAVKYNVNHFLLEFMKYYTKAPNFARNLVHADTITIRDLLVEGKQLFEYLLSYTSQYNFKVLEMETINGDPEYVLVQISTTSQVFYKDAQDCQHADDFDVTLVVYHLCYPYNPNENILHLKYYLILTSKNEIYPKADVEGKIGKFRTVSSMKQYWSSDKSPNDSTDKGDTSTSDEQSTTESSDSRYTHSINKRDSIYNVEISQERVNYLGYYSSHEELMQQLILERANVTRVHIKEMVAKGMIDCRTHLLWNQLTASQDTLSYDEFLELKDLSYSEHLCDGHPNLGFISNQPLTWYQGLAKLLMVKYTDQYRIFSSSDGNMQHYVILHPRYFGAFMMLSMDLQTLRGDLYAVYRETHFGDDFDLCLAYRKELLDGFVNCICFYLWSGMI